MNIMITAAASFNFDKSVPIPIEQRIIGTLCNSWSSQNMISTHTANDELGRIRNWCAIDTYETPYNLTSNEMKDYLTQVFTRNVSYRSKLKKTYAEPLGATHPSGGYAKSWKIGSLSACINTDIDVDCTYDINGTVFTYINENDHDVAFEYTFNIKLAFRHRLDMMPYITHIEVNKSKYVTDITDKVKVLYKELYKKKHDILDIIQKEVFAVSIEPGAIAVEDAYNSRMITMLMKYDVFKYGAPILRSRNMIYNEIKKARVNLRKHIPNMVDRLDKLNCQDLLKCTGYERIFRDDVAVTPEVYLRKVRNVIISIISYIKNSKSLMSEGMVGRATYNMQILDYIKFAIEYYERVDIAYSHGAKDSINVTIRDASPIATVYTIDGSNPDYEVVHHRISSIYNSILSIDNIINKILYY